MSSEFWERFGRKPKPPAARTTTYQIQVIDDTHKPIVGALVRVGLSHQARTDIDGMAWFRDIPWPADVQSACAEADGHHSPGLPQQPITCKPIGPQPDSTVLMLQRAAVVEPPTAPPAHPPAPTKRAGVVRLENQVAVDDTGSFLAIGTSFFVALWKMLHDRSNFDQSGAWLSGKVDYVRAFVTVSGSSWADRALNPKEPGFFQAFKDTTDVLYDTYGIRTQWTVFAGIGFVQTPAEQMALVEKLAALTSGREHKIFGWDVANEAWKNGFDSPAARKHVRKMADVLRQRTPHMVGTTAVKPIGNPAGWTEAQKEAARKAEYASWYGNGTLANLFIVHPERDMTGTGREWRPTRQAWEPQFATDLAWITNEPIGIGSSGSQEVDPLRLTMAAVMTWLCGGCAYTLHTGAGVRGGGAADLALGRKTNFWEQPTMEAALAGMRTARGLLPPRLPNFSRHNTNSNYPKYPFDTEKLQPYLRDESFVRAFVASHDKDFVMAPIRLMRPVPFVARRNMEAAVYDPLTGAELQRRTVSTGATLTITPRPNPKGDAQIVRGRYLD